MTLFSVLPVVSPAISFANGQFANVVTLCSRLMNENKTRNTQSLFSLLNVEMQKLKSGRVFCNRLQLIYSEVRIILRR